MHFSLDKRIRFLSMVFNASPAVPTIRRITAILKNRKAIHGFRSSKLMALAIQNRIHILWTKQANLIGNIKLFAEGSANRTIEWGKNTRQGTGLTPYIVCATLVSVSPFLLTFKRPCRKTKIHQNVP
jgi:hypothetical protein